MIRPIARSLAVAALLLLVFALVAQARPRTKREFVTAYPKTAGTRLDACITCHTSGGTALNPYGAALKRATVSFQAVEKLDSDGDGIANKVEIDALSFPGDAKDRPGARRDSSSVHPDSTARDSTGARPDTLQRPHVRPDSGSARPDTLKPPKNG